MLKELQASRIRPARGILNLPPDVFFRYMEGRILFVQEDWVARARRPGERSSRDDGQFGAAEVGRLQPWPLLSSRGRHGQGVGRLSPGWKSIRLYVLRTPAPEVYLGQGKINQAIAEYKQVVQSEHAADETWIELARMLVMKNLRMPAENRDWDEVDQVLKHAVQLMPSSPQVPLLAAEVLVARKLPEADALERLRDKHPEQIEFWSCSPAWPSGRKNGTSRRSSSTTPSIGSATRWGCGSRARSISCGATARTGETGEGIGGEDGQALPAEQRQLWGSLIGWSLQAGDDAQARQLSDRVAKKEPGNLQNHFLRFESALRVQDNARLEGILADIAKITGKSPMWLYGQAVRISLTAKGKDAASTEALNQALQYLSQAPPVVSLGLRCALLEAGIYDQLGKPALALERYQEAIQQGKRNRRPSAAPWKF